MDKSLSDLESNLGFANSNRREGFLFVDVDVSRTPFGKSASRAFKKSQQPPARQVDIGVSCSLFGGPDQIGALHHEASPIIHSVRDLVQDLCQPLCLCVPRPPVNSFIVLLARPLSRIRVIKLDHSSAAPPPAGIEKTTAPLLIAGRWSALRLVCSAATTGLFTVVIVGRVMATTRFDKFSRSHNHFPSGIPQFCPNR